MLLDDEEVAFPLGRVRGNVAVGVDGDAGPAAEARPGWRGSRMGRR